jgi:mono/diheme cytochrome c family protein
MANRAIVAAGVVLLAIASTSAQVPKTVLDGVFTAAQADRGGAIYGAKCAMCHAGADVNGPPLTGTPFIDGWREDRLASLFDFIKTQMPQSAPGSLPESSYLDVLAYLLDRNDFPAGSRELTAAVVGSTLLVGANGPQPLPSGALVQVVGCVAQNPTGEWVVMGAGDPARVRVGTEITPAEAKAAEAAPLGPQTFTLQNVGDGGTALPADGHKVALKGALTQRAGSGRLHVTAATSLAATCG